MKFLAPKVVQKMDVAAKSGKQEEMGKLWKAAKKIPRKRFDIREAEFLMVSIIFSIYRSDLIYLFSFQQ